MLLLPAPESHDGVRSNPSTASCDGVSTATGYQAGSLATPGPTKAHPGRRCGMQATLPTRSQDATETILSSTPIHLDTPVRRTRRSRVSRETLGYIWSVAAGAWTWGVMDLSTHERIFQTAIPTALAVTVLGFIVVKLAGLLRHRI